MLKGMEEGELPVVFNNNGTKVQIAKVLMSALALNTLSRVSRLIWRVDADTEMELKSIDDIMSALSAYIQRR